jgi:hypothetical protein
VDASTHERRVTNSTRERQDANVCERT